MRNQIACDSTAIAALTLFFVTPSFAGQSTWEWNGSTWTDMKLAS
jgi:hypothetical protein